MTSTRIRILTGAMGLFIALSMPHSTAHAALGFMEAWYMSRARSNMKIGNYKAAIEAYEKVVEKNPQNREAMHDLGIAYEAQGFRDKAIEQYDRYLSNNEDDPEIAFRQARNLEWSRYSYRRQDAIRYYRLGLKHRDDPKARLKYAQLLSERKETSAEAIEQYKKILIRDHTNVQAHSGLAKAYAWNGYNDQALYESNLALQYSQARTSADLGQVRKDLLKGRESTVGGKGSFLSQSGQEQSGNSYQLSGFSALLQGRRELSPFVTLRAEGGLENYWSPDQSAGGGAFTASTEFRFDPIRKIEAELGYHQLGFSTPSRKNLASYSGGAQNITFRLQYDTQSGPFLIQPGVKRELIYDSLQSLAGGIQSDGTALYGPSRANLFYTNFGMEAGDTELHLTPYLGWISTDGLDANAKVGADFSALRPILEESIFKLSAEYQAQLNHYAEDRSAPRPGGYFSPQFYAFQTVHAVLGFDLTDSQQLDLRAGPSLQYVKDSSSAAFHLGGEGRLAHVLLISKHFQWNNDVGFNQTGNLYNRFQLSSSLTYVF